MTNIVVSGVVANKPGNGGSVWERMSWALGFARLGCSVHFVEQIQPSACVDTLGRPTGFRESVNADFFARSVDSSLAGSALVLGDGDDVIGCTWEDLLAIARSADLLVDLGVHLRSRALLSCFRRRAVVDLDPGFTQVWHVSGALGEALGRYDVHFTVGENVGTSWSSIPDGGISWRPTRQPAVLSEWPMVRSSNPGRFTTVSSWRGAYGAVSLDGHQFDLKHQEWRKVVDLPERAPGTFEAAMAIHPSDVGDRELLTNHGWHVVDPSVVAGDAESFRHYVQCSGAEFSVAQGVYVHTHSGWFSDRTVRYLASGKPALVQDTGFGRNLPTGVGLVPFRSLDEAVAGAERIVQDYEAHCRAARAIAAEHFDSNAVITRFLEDASQ